MVRFCTVLGCFCVFFSQPDSVLLLSPGWPSPVRRTPMHTEHSVISNTTSTALNSWYLSLSPNLALSQGSLSQFMALYPPETSGEPGNSRRHHTLILCIVFMIFLILSGKFSLIFPQTLTFSSTIHE